MKVKIPYYLAEELEAVWRKEGLDFVCTHGGYLPEYKFKTPGEASEAQALALWHIRGISVKVIA